MKKHFTIFFLLIFISAVSAQNEQFLKRELIFQGDTLPYRILFPENYDTSQSYPLVLFLHGAGERGNDNQIQLIHGSALFLNQANRLKFPAIVIYPQCPKNKYWAPIESRENGFSYVNTKKPTEPMQLVIRLIKHIEKNEAVDHRRMYVLGLSMGGMGTFDLVCRYPRLFAAAVPICGGVLVDRLKKIKKLPVRIYHGSEDTVVSPEHSKNAYIELKANGSQDVELIIIPGVGHDSWNLAFKQEDFLSWIFSNKKR
ncbi:MAG: prolyl oligopeptidase family serine peptidase [Paludibacter sp.]|nr:prolyl oligopeptidase family serine peptidase [Paludibacter sp.]